MRVHDMTVHWLNLRLINGRIIDLKQLTSCVKTGDTDIITHVSAQHIEDDEGILLNNFRAGKSVLSSKYSIDIPLILGDARIGTVVVRFPDGIVTMSVREHIRRIELNLALRVVRQDPLKPIEEGMPGINFDRLIAQGSFL